MAEVSANPLRGTVPIVINDETYTMRLNWHGIAQIRRLYPNGYDLSDPEHLSVIISIAMSEAHPDMTPDMVMDLSPPIESAIDAVTDLINYAWWGSKKQPERKVEEEAEPVENPPKMKATAA